MNTDYVEFVRDIFAVTALRWRWSGQGFQSALAQVARGRRGRVVQGPGQTLLFGAPSSSGLRHEIDAGVQSQGWIAMLEAKAVVAGPTKNDLMIFDGKTLDFYFERIQASRPGNHYRVLVSGYVVPRAVAVFCYQRGVVAIEPGLIPIPVILNCLASPAADGIFSDCEMAEADRLFRMACAPMEEIWVPEGHRVSVALRRFSQRDAEDTRYMHERMSMALWQQLTLLENDWLDRLARSVVSRSTVLQALEVAA